MRAALAGTATLFLVPAAESPDRVAEHKAAVDAAVDAGVARIVYLSYQRAAPDAAFRLARDHWATEQHIRASGVAHCFPRMSMYLDFLPRLVGGDGAIAGPGGDGRVAPVSRADVADVVTALLTGASDVAGVHELTGGEALTLDAWAERLSALSGKRIAYRDETLEEARAARAAYDAPAWQVEAWISTYTAIAAGEADLVTDAVERLAGHPPRRLEDVVREQPEAFGHIR
jgi:uncharacterized protein YbjT (DUF2867 family)